MTWRGMKTNHLADHPQVASEAVQATRADRGHQALVLAAAFFTLAVLIHNADHVRRGADSASLAVFWVGTAAIGLEVAIVVL